MIYSQEFINNLRTILPYTSTIVQKVLEGEDIYRELRRFVRSEETDPLLAQEIWNLYEQEMLSNKALNQ